MNFGTVIREARERKRISLRQLGALVDCSAPFLSDVEHSRRWPGAELLSKLAEVLELDEAKLIALKPGLPSLEVRVARLEAMIAGLFRQGG